MRRTPACLAAAACLSLPVSAQTAQPAHLDGLFPLTWQAQNGRLLLTIPHPDRQFLLLNTLREGVGANDLGLDRGQIDPAELVEWRRFGPRLLLVEPNLMYRSSSADPDEQASVRDSFAQSVLWGFKIDHEDANGALTVDATDFFLDDMHGVGAQLVNANQGAFHLDAQRSAIEPEALKDFPHNTEVESLLTFTDADAKEPAKLIGTVTPNPRFVTVQEHFSLIELPPPGYTPRTFDPRAGYFEIAYRDFSAPLGQPMDVHLITRHRLIKKDPDAKVSDPVEPITYYVDRGAPEPVRSALIEGASWWNAAFEAAGFRNAFLVKELPPGADPEDIRYNMIDWVDRSTRGWSYGASVVDPRTGEILKGVVTLGSLRARQDFLIAEALLAPYTNLHATSAELKQKQADALQMVLERIRQLAAHETGHTLGLAHNFAASTIEPGASVMDYPHPMIRLDANGKPDVSHAYTTGVGVWDKAAIAYGYTQFAPGADVPQALDALLRKDTENGLVYLTDEDARPPGSLSPRAHLWDNGTNAADELNRMMKLRKAALDRFGENAIQPGAPLATLEDTLVPLYLLHRYQTEAAAKTIGGVDYRYALRGDGQTLQSIVPAAEQIQALDAVLSTLAPAALTLPANLLAVLPPRPPGYPRTEESFGGYTGLAFDPQGAVAAAANLTNSLLFESTRATRLEEQHAEDAGLPGLSDVLERTLAATWYAPVPADGAEAEAERTVQQSVLERLLGLASDADASPQARAVAAAEVTALRKWLGAEPGEPGSMTGDWHAAALRTIGEWEKNPQKFTPAPLPAAPPGQPIGEEETDEMPPL